MTVTRRDPVTLEQATLRCETCGELLAIVESVADTAVSVYLWRPVRDENGEEIRSPCHRSGVSDAQAIGAYHRDGCDQYWQSQIVAYTWPERDDVPIPLDEPVLVDEADTQLALLEGA